MGSSNIEEPVGFDAGEARISGNSLFAVIHACSLG